MCRLLSQISFKSHLEYITDKLFISQLDPAESTTGAVTTSAIAASAIATGAVATGAITTGAIAAGVHGVARACGGLARPSFNQP